MTWLLNAFISSVNTGSNSGAMICTGTLTFSISFFSSRLGCAVEMQSTKGDSRFAPRRKTAHPPKQKPTAPVRWYLVRRVLAHSVISGSRISLELRAKRAGRLSLSHWLWSWRISSGRTSPPKLLKMRWCLLVSAFGRLTSQERRRWHWPLPRSDPPRSECWEMSIHRGRG